MDRILILLAALLPLAACGDLPRPFAGHPGAIATRLLRPPPPRLVVMPPTTALLAAQPGAAFAGDLADALAAQEIPAFAEPPKSGDWRLVIGAQPSADGLAPVYTVEDPNGLARGSIAGPPLTPDQLGAAAPPMLHQAVADATPKVVALLTRIDATLRQSDPNSLLNRPARIAFTGVTGAPGDGNISLAKAMRTQMAQIGVPVQDDSADADFTVGCTVTATPAGGQTRVEIEWIVKDIRGREAGRVAQLNDIPPGTLDHFWGDVALVVAQQAAGGVKDVLDNQTGRRAAPSSPSSPQPAAARKP